MSKSKISTRERIVEKAIDLFNQYGIEYVGVRELAKELNMKGGNITYYFPTKDDLVSEIAGRLSGANMLLLSEMDKSGISGMLNIYETVYRTQYAHRSLFLSLPNLLSQNKAFAEAYRRNQQERFVSIRKQMEYLSEGGFLRKMTAEETELFVNMIAMITRFWIAEAAVENKLDTEEEAVEPYIRRLRDLMGLVATAKGRKDMARYSLNTKAG